MEGNINISTTVALNRSSDTDLWVFEDYNQRIAIATILCILFIVGFIGNTLVITAVVLSRKLRSSTNWFIVNLGCSDLLTCLCLPFNAVAMLSLDGWPLPGWICVASAAMVMICLGASVMTLALIAYNRWYLLTKSTEHFQKLFTTRNICFMVLSAWLYPAILVLVPSFAGLGRLGYSYEYKACTQDTSSAISDSYSLIAGAGAIMPVFIVIVVIYVRIYLFVSRHGKTRNKHKREEAPKSRSLNNLNLVPSTEPSNFTSEKATTPSRSSSNLKTSPSTVTCTLNKEGELTAIEKLPKEISFEISDNKSRRFPKDTSNLSDNKSQPNMNKFSVTITKRLAVVVLAFIICLLPFGVSVAGLPSDQGVPWTGLMVTFNSCVNPLIYAGTMPMFRKVMLAIICCRLKDIPGLIACVGQTIPIKGNK